MVGVAVTLKKLPVAGKLPANEKLGSGV